jgi:hypothetical protein
VLGEHLAGLAEADERDAYGFFHVCPPALR